MNATNNTNPNTLLGFGTWEPLGAGRVLVGIDSGDTDFDVLEETGGAKTHTLTKAELPPHVHDYTRSSQAGASTADGVSGSPHRDSGNATTDTENGSNDGLNGDAHNNVQPYIVVSIWKRTA